MGSAIKAVVAVSAIETIGAISTIEAIAAAQSMGAVRAIESVAVVEYVSANAIATVEEAVEAVGARSDGIARGARHTIVSDGETTSASVVFVLKLQSC